VRARVGVTVVATAALVSTSCGGSSDTYAGLTPTKAKQKADALVANQTTRPRLLFDRLERTHDPLTRRAWGAIYSPEERSAPTTTAPPIPGVATIPQVELPDMSPQPPCEVYVAKDYYFVGRYC
jgi:hypothetical protein